MAKFGLIGKNIDYSFSRGSFKNKFETENLSHEYINFDLENIRFIGKLVDIEVTEALSYSLLGTLHNPRGKD